MTARTRARPRGTRAPRTNRKKRSRFSAAPLKRPELLAVAAGAVLVAASLFLFDIPALAADVRDSLARSLGLGIAVLLGWLAFAAYAVAKRNHQEPRRLAQRSLGFIALGLFAWGTLGLNRADWSLGAVDFERSTLGGNVGSALVSGFLGKLAWLSLLIVAMALLAPGPTRWFARNAPRWAEASWERRYWHRAASGLGRFIAFAFRRPSQGDESELVIGSGGFERIEPMGRVALEDGPVIYRPSIDPGSPSSPVGAGAAVQFGASTMEAPAEVAGATPAAIAPGADEPDLIEPEQLGLQLDRDSGWQLPAIEMLNAPLPSASRKHDNAARAQMIVDTLASFGVDASVVEINEGPTVTQFGVEPGWEVRYKDLQIKDENGRAIIGGDNRPQTERVETSRTRVRVNRITALQNDLALALAAPSLRIEAPVPGRAIVGIEVPNDSATVVTMRTVMETKEFRDLASKTKLALALGKGVSGVPVVADLAKMPHLLIAGATGSGKSVCMNAVIAGLMMNATPDQVRFVMVDPKRVELTAYAGIPHLAFSEVIVDMDKVVGTLQAVVGEMDARYKKFASLGVRNIDSYNRHPRILKKIPYWVIIIDELADLMMAAPFEVEKLLCRLAQLARATGIHLVVATQRPSVDVVTGLIKANFPTRIAFAVTSQIDSRTILDMGGAEKLLGRGDMLFMPTDVAKPIRIQGVYVSDPEVERLVEFWKDDRFRALAPETADALLEQALIEQHGGETDIELDSEDPVIERARALTAQHQRVSPSLFQRRLRIGYLKAAKLIELLEEEGAIGPREEGESRRVLARAPEDELPW